MRHRTSLWVYVTFAFEAAAICAQLSAVAVTLALKGKHPSTDVHWMLAAPAAIAALMLAGFAITLAREALARGRTK